MYIIDFENGSAIQEYKTKKGNNSLSRFMIFLDSKGAFISTKNGKVYLNEENSYSL